MTLYDIRVKKEIATYTDTYIILNIGGLSNELNFGEKDIIFSFQCISYLEGFNYDDDEILRHSDVIHEIYNRKVVLEKKSGKKFKLKKTYLHGN